MKGKAETAYYGNTFEAEIILPRKYNRSEDNYFQTEFISSSIFGMHEPLSTINNNTWASPDHASLQAFAVKTELESNDIYFMLSSSHFGLELTSSVFIDAYADQKWLLSYRIRHEKYPFAGGLLGADTGSYVLEFTGINTELDIIKDRFSVSASIDQAIAEEYFKSAKKLYIGAHHTNFTGSTVVGTDGYEQLSDVQLGPARFWVNYLPDSVLESHATDMTNYGPEAFSKNVENYLTTTVAGHTIPQSETLVLHWNFEMVESSDNGAGTPILGLNDAGFDVIDMSSGSADELDRFEAMSELSRQLHPGRGNFFLRNSEGVVSYEYVPTAKRRLPEILNNDDLVNILGQDDLTYTRDMIPMNHFLSIEKSMYQNISEEMLRWIGTIKQFNNLIGKPTDRYEADYRDLQFLRRLFFLNTDETPDFEKFVEFFKWIDESVARIIGELVPASMNINSIASNVVESHILERNKYRHKLPTIEFKGKEPVAAVRTINELKYNWKFGHAPIPLQEKNNCLWWKERFLAKKEDQQLETDREKIFAVLKSTYDRKFTTVYDLNVDAIVIINKNPKEQEVVKQITKFGSGEYLEIDIPLIVDEKDCNDK